MSTTPVAERSNEVERQTSDTSSSPYRPTAAIHGARDAMAVEREHATNLSLHDEKHGTERLA